MNFFIGLCVLAGISALFEFAMNAACPWTMESQTANSLLNSLINLLKYVVEIYLVFLTLIVATGFGILYPTPNETHFKIVAFITIVKFILDLVASVFGMFQGFMHSMMMAKGVFDMLVMCMVLYMVIQNLRKVSFIVSYLEQN